MLEWPPNWKSVFFPARRTTSGTRLLQFACEWCRRPWKKLWFNSTQQRCRTCGLFGVSVVYTFSFCPMSRDMFCYLEDDWERSAPRVRSGRYVTSHGRRTQEKTCNSTPISTISTKWALDNWHRRLQHTGRVCLVIRTGRQFSETSQYWSHR